MGILTIRTALYLGVIGLGFVLFVYTVIAGGMTWLKAMNSGILQFHKIFPRIYYWANYILMIACLVVSVMNFTGAYTCRRVIDDSEVIGTEAFSAYEEPEDRDYQDYQDYPDSGVDPEAYLLIKQSEYENKIDHQRQNGFFYLFLSMAWFSIMMLQTGFITQNGYYAMGAQKPKRLMPVQEQERICFYLVRNSRNKNQDQKSEKCLFSMKDTPENIAYFTPLFQNYADYQAGNPENLENSENPGKHAMKKIKRRTYDELQ